jgi:hypothetical protein
MTHCGTINGPAVTASLTDKISVTADVRDLKHDRIDFTKH